MRTEGSFIAGTDFRGKIPAFVMKAEDTTAAGDVYCGSLAVSLAEGQTPQQVVGFASAAWAISVTRLGTQPSAHGWDGIEWMLGRDKCDLQAGEFFYMQAQRYVNSVLPPAVFFCRN